LKVGWKGFEYFGTGMAISAGLNKEAPILDRTLNFGFAGLGALGIADDIGKGYGWARSKYLPGSVKYVDDLSFDDAKALRDRATVLVKDKKTGKYLVELDKNTGMYITPGGAVDKGEDFLKAAQRELFEETGMKVKPSQLKFTDEFITSRERYKVFSLDVEDAKNLNLFAQAKEVKAFKWVDAPSDYMGATTAKPFGQKANPWKFWDKSVRSDDLYALSRAGKVDDVAKQIKNLSPTQKTSLINEARQWALNNFGAERIKGISNDKLLKDYLLNQQRGLFRQLIINPAEETFMRRGQEVNLRKRVKEFKWSSAESWGDFIKGRKPGQFKAWQPFSGIEVGFGSRYDVPFDFLKEYKGKKMTYVHGSPGQIPTQTNTWADMQGMKIKGQGLDETFEVFKGKNVRGRVFYISNLQQKHKVDKLI
jgi:8-oxo-dGTP pyrophosphatase MutT (NUDIX family)